MNPGAFVTSDEFADISCPEVEIQGRGGVQKN